MKEVFVYVGGDQKVPKDIELARIDPSVKVIEKGAFKDCRKLKYVQFCSNGGVLQEIGVAAFSGCQSLESIRLASTTRSIHKSAFEFCGKLRYVIMNEGLEVIGPDAFAYCASMEYLVLPSTMRHIQGRAFRYCKGLKEALFNQELAEVGAHAFQFCTRLKQVILPGYYGGILGYDFCATKLGLGAKKWLRLEPTKDDQFWNLISISMDHADKEATSKYFGMPAIAHYGEDSMMPHSSQQQQTISQLKEEIAQGKTKRQELEATLESLKNKYVVLQNQYNSIQLAYHQLATREEESRRRLHASLAPYYYYMNMNNARQQQPITRAEQVLQQSASGRARSLAGDPAQASLNSNNNSNASSSSSQEKNKTGSSYHGGTPDKTAGLMKLKRKKVPMQDSTNAHQHHQQKKLRPLC